MRTLMFIAALFSLSEAAVAAPSVSASWRYERADNARTETGAQRTPIPAAEGRGLSATDRGMQKTILAADMAKSTLATLGRYENACSTIRGVDLIMPPSCAQVRRGIAGSLRQEITGWSARVNANRLLGADKEIADALDLLRKLAANMETGAASTGGFEEPLPRPTGPFPPPAGPLLRSDAAFASGLGVTGGGAQGFGYFRKLVGDGLVPKAEVLTVEGFMRELDLSLLDAGPCRSLVCVNPAVAVDPAKSRMYVQIGMNSSVTPQAFQRSPLNLSVVVDVSGSMSGTDATEKTRLAWAKDALVQTIGELDQNDVLSIVTFDTTSQVLLRPERVRDKARLVSMVQSLVTRGSTNLEAGLRDGFELASENVDRLPNHEHRVILISDAGLNTGVTDDSALTKLVTDYAGEGIGLTALGLGQNFNQSFIHDIANSRGGNYLFVQTGRDMVRYFDAFSYLVTPVAYDFKVRLALEGTQARLLSAYGVATEGGAQPAREIIDLRTLFFSEGGGAILLEYELPRGTGRE
ncbi:vWA domain-containing protein [Polyangium aurulentum]|uniref:vWA domain-containing protein n=1 Tax=Polyangium aurulentum TaxID=2567896 RepID=UPI00146D7F13|nr:VWA domain-containing protein [Polyangium aurulentum]UQA60336.1 VWA domain-containing protein [Polyangium aurulentum]